MDMDLIDARFMFLVSIADKIAEKMNVGDTDSEQLIFEYENIHYVLHKYDDKWGISYPHTDKYWFDYIEDNPPINLDITIAGLKEIK